MKNNKGFTLVELLAVIAILAILIVLAVPSVMKVFNNAKMQSFITEVKGLEKSINSLYMKETLRGNKLTEINSNGSIVLDLSGEDLEYYITLDNKGNITNIMLSNSKYCINTNKKLSDLTVDDIKTDKCFVMAKCLGNSYEEGTLMHSMLKDNCVYQDNIKSKYVTLENGINYTKSAETILGLYEETSTKGQTTNIIIDDPANYLDIEVENVVNNNENNVKFMFRTRVPLNCVNDDVLSGAAETYTLDPENGRFTLNNYHCLKNDTFDNSSINGYICYESGDEEDTEYAYSSDMGCSNIARILEVKDGKVTKADLITSNILENDVNGHGLYYSTSPNISASGKKIYFYRGNVDNNNVIFADKCWKIMRTTDNENIKIIYNGVPSNGKCSQQLVGHNSPEAISGIYSFRADSISNLEYKNSSIISAKKSIDEWYKNNILEYSAKYFIADEIYCNDLKEISSEDYYAHYKTFNGYTLTDNFNMFCPQNIDKYTVSDTIGNGKLDYPVALITLNEGLLAGHGKNILNYDDKSSYLSNDDLVVTMTPSYMSMYGLSTNLFYIKKSGVQDITSDIAGTGGSSTILYPVLALKSDVRIYTGTGSTNNPYIIDQGK